MFCVGGDGGASLGVTPAYARMHRRAKVLISDSP